MRIKRIDDALMRCEEHLLRADVIDVEVRNLLVQSLLILICAEFERKFKDMTIKRCSSVSDESIRSYIERTTERIFRSLRLQDVSRLLAQFGPMHKERFERLRDNKADQMYSSIINNRNDVAHGGTSNVTIEDVRQYYQEGHVVLDYFGQALGVDSMVRPPPRAYGRKIMV